MNDDELKSLYNASSTERPAAKVDASIIAEAEQALNQDSVTKKTTRTGWRPVFATAASLTLVIALAFQMTPQQQEEWPENGITEPASSLTKARDEEVIVVTGSRIASDVNEAEPEMKQQAAESFVASPETAAEESPSAADHAHSRADKLRTARIEERQRQRKLAIQEKAELEEKAMQTQQSSLNMLSQAGLQRELERIISLHENGQVDAAESAWQELLALDLTQPQDEPNKSLWLQVVRLFE